LLQSAIESVAGALGDKQHVADDFARIVIAARKAVRS
jgi:hypothetical protein